jgi:hypothetical protein
MVVREAQHVFRQDRLAGVANAHEVAAVSRAGDIRGARDGDFEILTAIACAFHRGRRVDVHREFADAFLQAQRDVGWDGLARWRIARAILDADE